jgi:hypothetical protein
MLIFVASPFVGCQGKRLTKGSRSVRKPLPRLLQHTILLGKLPAFSANWAPALLRRMKNAACADPRRKNNANAHSGKQESGSWWLTPLYSNAVALRRQRHSGASWNPVLFFRTLNQVQGDGLDRTPDHLPGDGSLLLRTPACCAPGRIGLSQQNYPFIRSRKGRGILPAPTGGDRRVVRDPYAESHHKAFR